jgi:FHA domain-containing protein
MTRAEFEGRYPHLWLVRELAPDDGMPSGFNTVAWDSKKTISAGKKLKNLRESGAGLAALLRHDPGHFGFYPLIKGGANPWAERILVGRASNNDIVIRHESVSKVHAYFEKAAHGALNLHDAKSANGTRVDGEPVDPNGGGVALKSGATLLFGLLACEVISSGDLFDALG